MKNRGAKMVVAVMMAVLSSGCPSLPQIRMKEAAYTTTSAKSPQDLSKCIEFKMREGGQGTVTREEHENNVYRVIISGNAGIVGDLQYVDILVKPKDSGSAVELRRRSLPVGQTALEEIIERCAK